jgi:hypothetical protein
VAIYFPLLKSKRGEFRALSKLAAKYRGDVLPTIDILPISEVGKSSEVTSAIEKTIVNIRSFCAGYQQLGIDLFDFKPEWRGKGGEHPVTQLCAAVADIDQDVILGIGLDRDEAYWEAAVAALGNKKIRVKSLFVRLQLDDIETPRICFEELEHTLNKYDCKKYVGHFVLDLRNISINRMRDLVAVCAKFLSNDALPSVPMVIVSGSIPLSISELLPKANTFAIFPRLEHHVWIALNKAIADKNVDLRYGDYGVVHSEYHELDPKLLGNMGPKIRYTLRAKWYVSRGKSFRHHQDGYGQYHRLAAELVESGYFSGREYSFGDEYIYLVATKDPNVGTGNQETWITACSNHHFTKVVRTLKRRTRTT